MLPIEFPRRILLAVTGLTPQVVTETLYALSVQQPVKFVPTEIHVITTAEGANRIRSCLLDAVSGQFQALCKDYGLGDIQFGESELHVIEGDDGTPLQDIRTPEDNMRAADFIMHYVREYCGDPDSALHVSIAGGRKSMGFFAGYALSLFGRSQDRISHVLVNEPFESLRDFYYPPREGKVLSIRENGTANTADAKVMLADIPFVRLRGGVPESLEAGASFKEAVRDAQAGVIFISLAFDMKASSICFGGKWVKLPDSLFCFYYWLAEIRCRDGNGDGAIGWRDASASQFLGIYASVVGSMSAKLDQAKHALRNGFENGEFFEQKKSKVNRLIKKALPLTSGFYLIVTHGNRPYVRYGIKLNQNQISL